MRFPYKTDCVSEFRAENARSAESTKKVETLETAIRYRFYMGFPYKIDRFSKFLAENARYGKSHKTRSSRNCDS